LGDHWSATNGLLERKYCLEIAGAIEINDAFEA
jgi:hypothetical protein